MFRSLIALPLLALAGGAAFAETPQREIGKPASIPFVDMRGIEDFQPDGDHAVIFRIAAGNGTMRRSWGRASACPTPRGSA